MATFRSIRKNLDRNIEPYKRPQADVRSFAQSFAAFIAALLFIAGLPLFSISFAANLSVRIPDTYAVDLDRSGAIKETDIGVEADDVADLISKYMLHKHDSFQLSENQDGRKKPIFTIGDGAAMQKLRKEADSALPALPISLLLFIAGLIYMVRTKRPRLIRRSIAIAWLLYLLTLGALAFVYYNHAVSTAIWRGFLGVSLLHTDTLPMLFGRELFLIFYVVTTAVSLVFMIIVHSAGFALSRNRDTMFT